MHQQKTSSRLTLDVKNVEELTGDKVSTESCKKTGNWWTASQEDGPLKNLGKNVEQNLPAARKKRHQE